MESAAKRYFWIVNLALLAALAYLAALVANNLVAEQIVGFEPVRKKVTKTAKKQSTVKGAAAEWGEDIRNRNLFNANPPEPEDPDSQDETEEEKKEEALNPEKAPQPGEDCTEWEEATVRLNATLVADPAAWSTATVTEDGASRMLRVGDMVGNHELVAIQRERLILAEGNKFKCVKSARIASSKGKKYPSGRSTYSGSKSRYSKSSSKSDSEKVKAGVKKVGKNTYQVDRDMLNEQLDDLGKLSRQARVIPHYRGGKPQGFKLVGVRPGSLYSHLGVRSGDILKSVNGEGITSPTKALELFEKLKSTESVTIDLERRGRKTTYEYLIK